MLHHPAAKAKCSQCPTGYNPGSLMQNTLSTPKSKGISWLGLAEACAVLSTPGPCLEVSIFWVNLGQRCLWISQLSRGASLVCLQTLDRIEGDWHQLQSWTLRRPGLPHGWYLHSTSFVVMSFVTSRTEKASGWHDLCGGLIPHLQYINITFPFRS